MHLGSGRKIRGQTRPGCRAEIGVHLIGSNRIRRHETTAGQDHKAQQQENILHIGLLWFVRHHYLGQWLSPAAFIL
jgi:hypothetical protein